MSSSTSGSPTTSEARRVAFAGAVGTTIEWYDFFIYGTAAALVFGPQFFPQVSALAGTLASFATFAIGFIAHPLGGIVMGHFGFDYGALLRQAVSRHPRGEAILTPQFLSRDPVSAISLGLALMFGTAGLPHVLVRFYTVPDARTARVSVVWAMGIIGTFYIMTTFLGFGAATEQGLTVFVVKDVTAGTNAGTWFGTTQIGAACDDSQLNAKW